MIRKRIGKTIIFRWTITTDGEALPLDYVDNHKRDLTLFLIDPSGNSNQIYFEIDTDNPNKNTIIFSFQGKDQTKVGHYSLELWENKGQDEQTVVDKINAFELVKHTKDEGGCGCRNY